MPIADDSALCRLLCAAEASYGIQPGRPFAQVDPWYHQVGFIGAPTVVEAGPAEIDAALVGLSGDGAFAAAYNAKVTQWRYENYLAKAHSLVRYPLGYCRAVCDSGLCAGEAPK